MIKALAKHLWYIWSVPNMPQYTFGQLRYNSFVLYFDSVNSQYHWAIFIKNNHHNVKEGTSLSWNSMITSMGEVLEPPLQLSFTNILFLNQEVL